MEGDAGVLSKMFKPYMALSTVTTCAKIEYENYICYIASMKTQNAYEIDS